MQSTRIIPVAADAILLHQLERTTNTSVFVSARLLARQFTGQDNEGLLCLSEYANFLRNLRLTTSAELLADGQSGFGNALNTYYMACELARSGADRLVLNDQSFPAHSLTPQQPVSLLNFAGKLKAAQDGLKEKSTGLVVKLDGIQYYGISGIKERIKIAKKLGIASIIIGHLNTELFLELENKVSLTNIGLAQDNELISIAELEQAVPAFIIPIADSIKYQEKMTAELISRLEEKQYEKL